MFSSTRGWHELAVTHSARSEYCGGAARSESFWLLTDRVGTLLFLHDYLHVGSQQISCIYGMWIFISGIL